MHAGPNSALSVANEVPISRNILTLLFKAFQFREWFLGSPYSSHLGMLCGLDFAFSSRSRGELGTHG